MARNLFVAILLTLALALFLSCANKKGLDADLSEGLIGNACFFDGSCVKGLLCVEGICVEGPAAGDEGGECLVGDLCNEGLECLDGICRVKEEEIIVGPKPGTEGGECLEGDVCNEGLACVGGICEESFKTIGIDDPKINADYETGTKINLACPLGMVFVKGGTFTMGSDLIWDAKKHLVTLSDYCMDSRPFTNGDKKKNEAIFNIIEIPSGLGAVFYEDKKPLVNVNWNQARYICEEQGKRLPTEAEWEYAARNRGLAEFGHGTVDGTLTVSNACWSPESRPELKKESTCDVGQYPKNPLGLYDMTGNVWEWVWDLYATYPDVALPLVDPTGPETGTYGNVKRGGAWNQDSYQAKGLSAAGRENNQPEVYNKYLGFRCAAKPL